MYALAIVRYRRPLEEAEDFREAHRNYLFDLKQRALLIASGPFETLISVVRSSCVCQMATPAKPWIAFATRIRLQYNDWRTMNC